MKEIKLKECPCCGGEAEVKDIKYKSMPAITWVECKKCGLQTKTFKQSIYYCAKEAAAEAWNERHKETNQNDFGGITADELERALEECVKELVAMKNPEEEKYRRTPKCPICREEGLHIMVLHYLPDKARAQIHCDMCGTDINIYDTSKCIGEMSELVHNEK